MTSAQNRRSPIPRTGQSRQQRTQPKEGTTNIICIVHREGDPFAIVVIHVQRGRLSAVPRRIHELEFPRTRRNKIRRAILVPERVATDNDRFNPSGNRPRDTLEDDRFSEDCAADGVADLRAYVQIAKKKRGQDTRETRTVAFGERHICLRLNSFTRASSGVTVAHLIPTLYLRIASADLIVTLSSVLSLREIHP